ncbi:MAG: outer membrane protein transport protein [Chitinophagales bacterium]|nr:outer membrane protein transport protein [Chitinophagaceae bacterium]MCB9065209.1 outer membrane protein transport protein [Chitinophagales bacterium]
MKKHFLLIGSLLLTSMVYGAGFQLNLQGMRQLAMGGSGTAIPWDASTVFYNPGGLSALENVQIYGSVNALMPRARFAQAPTGTYTVDANSKTYTPFNLYVAGPLGYKTPWSFGVGVYTPFGTGIDWGKDWVGRFIIQDISLQTIFIQPTVSYQIAENISLGAGFVYATGNVELNKAIPTINSAGGEGQARLTGRANGVGFNVGLHLTPSEDVVIGFTYRSQVNMKVKRGYAEFSNIPSTLSSSFVNTAFKSELPLPQVASVGIGVHVSEKVTLQFDANYTGWASYDSLIFDFENNTSALSDSRSPRRYKSTVALRGGMHYQHSDRFALMVGTAYDPSPVRDGFVNPDLPDSKRILATGGLSFKLWERLTAIGVFEYVFADVRTGTSNENGFTGKYQSRVVNPGIAITYDFK